LQKLLIATIVVRYCANLK